MTWQDGKAPTPYQEEIISILYEKGRVSARGLHGWGKTALAAWAIIHFATTRDIDEDWKIPTTASVWRQLSYYLWPEVHKWVHRLDWKKMGRDPFGNYELLKMNLSLNTGVAFAASSDNPELIEGAHADSLLYILDEAKMIQDAVWDSIEGAFSGAGTDTVSEAYCLAISTPGPTAGRFYDIHSRKPGYEDWHVRHVTLDEAIKAGRVSMDWVKQRAKQWGEESILYKNKVLGEFASQQEDSLIPLAWVEAAVTRWHKIKKKNKLEITHIGLDVAREGKDKTVFALRAGNVITKLIKFHGYKTMQTVGVGAGLMNKYKEATIIVDTIGVGAGVYDRLEEQGYNVQSFKASEKAESMDRYEQFGFLNKRSEAWWRMRELLDPENGYNIALPPDDDLIGDLTAPSYEIMSNAKIKVDSKEKTKNILGRSPDSGDAVIQSFYEIPEVGALL